MGTPRALVAHHALDVAMTMLIGELRNNAAHKVLLGRDAYLVGLKVDLDVQVLCCVTKKAFG